MSRLALLPLLLALAACGARQEHPVSIPTVSLPSVPESDLTCSDEPAVPQPRAGETRVRESQVQNWILDLRTAGADCRSKLGVIRGTWRAVEKKQAEVSRAIPPSD